MGGHPIRSAGFCPMSSLCLTVDFSCGRSKSPPSGQSRASDRPFPRSTQSYKAQSQDGARPTGSTRRRRYSTGVGRGKRPVEAFTREAPPVRAAQHAGTSPRQAGPCRRVRSAEWAAVSRMGCHEENAMSQLSCCSGASGAHDSPQYRRRACWRFSASTASRCYGRQTSPSVPRRKTTPRRPA